MDSNRIWVLMGKKESGEATDSEIRELDGLMAVHHGAGYSGEVIDKLWQVELKALPASEPADNVWTAIDEAINPHSKQLKRISRNWWRVAAAVIFLLLAGVWYWDQLPAGNAKIAALTEISTKMASKSKMVLPDGTQVSLNGNSRLVYNAREFGQLNREVKLIGEAFFDVTKDAAHPFVIHAGNVNITVMGTAFNVKAYPRQMQVETSLLRGLVEVTTVDDPERKILLKPDEKIIIPVLAAADTLLKKKEQSPATSPYRILRLKKDEHQVLPETAWMNKTLEFDNETFEELVPKLESWYSVNIHFKNEKLKQKRFSGLIENESLKQTLNALKLSYPFTYSIVDDEVTIGLK